MTIQAFLKKEEMFQIHNLTLHLKKLEKEQHVKSKTSRREIIKIRAEINDSEIKNKKQKNKTKQQQKQNTVEQVNETRSWFFEKINKIDKSLARLIQKKKDPNK